jgi:16S rRNA (guanine966-N2)-methyltransferase
VAARNSRRNTCDLLGAPRADAVSARLYTRRVLKILSGEYRSRILLTPEGEDRTRPMVARVKESVFAMLHGWFKDARVLDLFAGVGTVGLECASRGAREVVCVERDREVFRYLEHNIATLKAGERVTALQADALGPTALARSPKPVDLVFMDPPYALMVEPATRKLVLAQAARTRALFAPKGFLVLRTPVDLEEPERSIPGFRGPEAHQYKDDMWVYLYMPDEGESALGDAMHGDAIPSDAAPADADSRGSEPGGA